MSNGRIEVHFHPLELVVGRLSYELLLALLRQTLPSLVKMLLHSRNICHLHFLKAVKLLYWRSICPNLRPKPLIKEKSAWYHLVSEYRILSNSFTFRYSGF